MRLVRPEPRDGKPWSDEEDNRLFTLRGRGLSFTDIGRHLRRSGRSCNNRFNILAGADRGVRSEAKPAVAATGQLLSRCLDLFDGIVDSTGCSFVAAMAACGMDGEVAV